MSTRAVALAFAALGLGGLVGWSLRSEAAGSSADAAVPQARAGGVVDRGAAALYAEQQGPVQQSGEPSGARAEVAEPAPPEAVAVEQSATLFPRLVTEDGAPFVPGESVWVYLEDAEGGAHNFSQSGPGAFVFTDLPPGPAAVSAHCPTSAAKGRIDIVAGDQPAALTLPSVFFVEVAFEGAENLEANVPQGLRSQSSFAITDDRYPDFRWSGRETLIQNSPAGSRHWGTPPRDKSLEFSSFYRVLRPGGAWFHHLVGDAVVWSRFVEPGTDLVRVPVDGAAWKAVLGRLILRLPVGAGSAGRLPRLSTSTGGALLNVADGGRVDQPMAPGAYTLHLGKGGRLDFEIAAGSVTDLGDLSAHVPRTIAGRVVDGQGMPVSGKLDITACGVDVRLESESGLMSLELDPEGGFTALVGPSAYRLSMRQADGSSISHLLPAGQSDVRGLELVVARGCTVSIDTPEGARYRWLRSLDPPSEGRLRGAPDIALDRLTLRPGSYRVTYFDASRAGLSETDFEVPEDKTSLRVDARG